MADTPTVSDDENGSGDPVEIPGSKTPPDVGATHPTGDEQAAVNREDDPPV